MHDQVGMRVADRFADLAEQVEAGGDVELARLAITGDRLAVDVFQREVGLPVLVDAGIQQARDVGMGEAGEDFAFAVEALAQAGIGQPGAQQLQCDLALVQAIGARGQPDLAHAAFADQPVQPVRADAGTRPCPVRHFHHRLGEELGIAFLQRQQFREFVGECGILAAQCGEMLAALVVRQFEQCIEQWREAQPAFGVHGRPLRPAGGQAAGDSCSEASRNIRAFCQSRRTLRSERCSRAAISSSDRPAK